MNHISALCDALGTDRARALLRELGTKQALRQFDIHAQLDTAARCLASGEPRAEAARKVADLFGVTVRTAYRRVNLAIQTKMIANCQQSTGA